MNKSFWHKIYFHWYYTTTITLKKKLYYFRFESANIPNPFASIVSKVTIIKHGVYFESYRRQKLTIMHFLQCYCWFLALSYVLIHRTISVSAFVSRKPNGTGKLRRGVPLSFRWTASFRHRLLLRSVKIAPFVRRFVPFLYSVSGCVFFVRIVWVFHTFFDRRWSEWSFSCCAVDSICYIFE